MRYVILGVLFVSFLLSCKKDDGSDMDNQAVIDDKLIQKYILDNNLEAKKHESGLYYIVSKQGTGEYPTENSWVRVEYKGYLTGGEIFDTSGGFPRGFYLERAIKGWKIGIPLFKEGGEGCLIIPSYLGYGNKSIGGGKIPPNSILIFDIKLYEHE